MDGESAKIIKELAPVVLAEVKKAKSILLHCHPKPDPDSVGSALAMKLALEQIGKKATLIKGDSRMPEAFMHLPGARGIVSKNFFEIDQAEFDLFICQDSSSPQMVSRAGKLGAPMPIKTVIIDHHRSNERFGSINLVASALPATSQLLFEIFKEWGIDLTRDIAANLFAGIYSDTGGMKYMGANERTYEIMTDLVKTGISPFHILDPIENSYTPASMSYLCSALKSIETFVDGKVAIASVSSGDLSSHGITESDMSSIQLAHMLRRVIGWDLDVSMVELKPGEIKLGFRTRDEDRFDVSKIAVAFGGGGHKAAAGAGITGKTLAEAKEMVVAKAKELYNL